MSFIKKNAAAAVEKGAPKCLYVRGANILLAGFNGEYVRRDMACWHRAEHDYFGFAIRPVEIAFDGDGIWVLRSTDSERRQTRFSKGANWRMVVRDNCQ